MKYLLIKGIAGLGNRVLAVATGLLYAELTGRRPIVDWSDEPYSGDGSDSFRRFFDAPSVGHIDEIPDTASTGPERWQGRLHERVRPVGGPRMTRRYLRTLHTFTSVDLLRTDHTADVLVMWSSRERIAMLRPHLRGEHAELAPLPTDAILRRTLETGMPLRREIRERVEQFRDERLAGPAVGVHVRYADLKSRVGAIRRRLDRLLATEPGLTVFLATDNVAMRDEFERAYGAVSAPHWYAAPGEVLHHGLDRPDPFERGVEGLVDMHLLAGCDHLIGDSKSSFARVAMLRSTAPRSQISDVQALHSQWHLPVKEAWRHIVPGPAAPLAVAVARLLAR